MTTRGKGRRRRAGGGPAKKAGTVRRGRAPAGRGAAEARVPPRLWAPWRMQFIEAEKAPGCIFCDYPAQPEDADQRNLLVHRGGQAFTLLNRYPYNSGHVMVIPRAHVSQLEDLAPEDFAGLHAELRLAVEVLRRVYRPDGLNVGMNLGRIAGAGIADHLHYHVVPRWAGDTNFMPVLADVRVMVQHLDDTWEKVRKGFQAA